ncbi:uncharacterized protein LOC129865410 isoform X2 [Salvelinus fontinalis]|uniref:uncharacterized protein LOC129865410 isoform X2 n=1 Tax=Salvelinus fontinalis TaxID=8038 RepID=UPI0024851255|nr:uncharacterized protein LOC129865410 isoform X2 [Salvelinus fontinalis]
MSVCWSMTDSILLWSMTDSILLWSMTDSILLWSMTDSILLWSMTDSILLWSMTDSILLWSMTDSILLWSMTDSILLWSMTDSILLWSMTDSILLWNMTDSILLWNMTDSILLWNMTDSILLWSMTNSILLWSMTDSILLWNMTNSILLWSMTDSILLWNMTNSILLWSMTNSILLWSMTDSILLWNMTDSILLWNMTDSILLWNMTDSILLWNMTDSILLWSMTDSILLWNMTNSILLWSMTDSILLWSMTDSILLWNMTDSILLWNMTDSILLWSMTDSILLWNMTDSILLWNMTDSILLWNMTDSILLWNMTDSILLWNMTDSILLWSMTDSILLWNMTDSILLWNMTDSILLWSMTNSILLWSMTDSILLWNMTNSILLWSMTNSILLWSMTNSILLWSMTDSILLWSMTDSILLWNMTDSILLWNMTDSILLWNMTDSILLWNMTDSILLWNMTDSILLWSMTDSILLWSMTDSILLWNMTDSILLWSMTNSILLWNMTNSILLWNMTNSILLWSMTNSILLWNMTDSILLWNMTDSILLWNMTNSILLWNMTNSILLWSMTNSILLWNMTNSILLWSMTNSILLWSMTNSILLWNMTNSILLWSMTNSILLWNMTNSILLWSMTNSILLWNMTNSILLWSMTNSILLWNMTNSILLWSMTDSILLWNMTDSILLWNMTDSILLWNMTDSILLWNMTNSILLWNMTNSILLWNMTNSILLWNMTNSILLWNMTNSILLWNMTNSILLWNMTNSILLWNMTNSILLWNMTNSILLWNMTNSILLWNMTNSILLWSMTDSILLWNMTDSILLWNMTDSILLWSMTDSILLWSMTDSILLWSMTDSILLWSMTNSILLWNMTDSILLWSMTDSILLWSMTDSILLWSMTDSKYYSVRHDDAPQFCHSRFFALPSLPIPLSHSLLLPLYPPPLSLCIFLLPRFSPPLLPFFSPLFPPPTVFPSFSFPLPPLFSSRLASAVLLYLRHSGIKLRDSRVFPGLSTEKEKWLAFFPKTKKLSSSKKEKDGEDRKRNPILKYIGKPRSTSQSTFHVPLSPTEVRPGSVRNIIQQFENHTEIPGEEGAEGDPPRLSSSSLGEDSMDSPTVSMRLARSESLKAQGEGRRRGGSSGAETVPRSRSDVDMEDCGEESEGPGLRPLHHSTSSASSSSARSCENPTPPYTPRSSRRKSMEFPVALLPDAPALEEDVVDSHNWQETVAPQVLATLCPREVDRQAVIYELLTTEASHLRTLRVLDQVFFQKMRCVLSSDELACIFPNLPQVYELHASLCEAMKKRRESPIVQGIGDIMLARFEGVAGEEFQEQASHLCSQQSQALELIKNKQRKDPRFAHIIQECEASPHCRRLQLKDLLVSETQRLTKYPLLLDNILKHTEAGSTDLPPLQQAQACCRGILQAVNEVVRETEHRQRLNQYQRRLDPTPQFKSLDLTSKRMIHEGPLTWKVSKDKTLEIQALLLSDLLVLLQRGPDDRLLLRCPSRLLGGGGGGSGDTKASFSPVVQLDSLLVRSVATDNKALYVISTTEQQIYELVAGTSSEKNIWKDQLEKTISLAAGSSPSTNNRSTPISSPSLGNASPVSTGSHVYQSDDSMAEQAVSMGTNSPNDEDNELTPTTPTAQSGSFLHSEGRDYVKRQIGVAEAALEDVEMLKQLIFHNFEEVGWSHDSDGTPTNETANERSPLNDRRRPASSETLLSASPSQLEAEDSEAPPSEVGSPSVHVVRKAVVAGSPSIPDDITDVNLHSDQSPEPRGGASVRGNVFYLVMPTEQGDGLLDESHTDEVIDPPTLTSTELPDLDQEVMSSNIQHHEEEGQVSSTLSAGDQSEPGNPRQEVGLGQSQKVLQSHVIKHVDEIFHTIEELMSKLHQLRDIETAHHQLLKTLREPPVNQESDDLPRNQQAVVTTPSLDRDPGDEPAKPEILSTGF